MAVNNVKTSLLLSFTILLLVKGEAGVSVVRVESIRRQHRNSEIDLALNIKIKALACLGRHDGIYNA